MVYRFPVELLQTSAGPLTDGVGSGLIETVTAFVAVTDSQATLFRVATVFLWNKVCVVRAPGA